MYIYSYRIHDFMNVYFYVQYHRNNTLELRLYLFLQDMHELMDYIRHIHINIHILE